MFRIEYGRRSGCLLAFVLFTAITVAITVMALAIWLAGATLCVAAGLGLWLLARYIWRELVRERPGSILVAEGLKLPPIGRKVAAGIPCALLSVALLAAYIFATQTASAASAADQANQASRPPQAQEQLARGSAAR